MKNKLNTIIFLLILALGAFFRFYKFETIPYGINHDGAQDALQAVEILHEPWTYKPYFSGGSGETLFKYYLSLFIKVFGLSVWSVKLASTFISFATVLIFYLFAKKLTGLTNALFATFFLATSGWSIIMGKTVWRAISTPFIECFVLYFLVRIIQKNQYRDYFFCGLFLTLSLNTYNAARSLLVFVAFFLIINLIRNVVQRKMRRKIIFGNIIFFLVFLISIFPLVSYALNNWSEFNSRYESLSLISRISRNQSVEPIWENIRTSLLLFNVKANGDDFFTSQPLLDQLTSLAFVIGVVYCLLNTKKYYVIFLLSGLLINLLPGIMSIPNGNRVIATMPFVYMISGLGFSALLRISEKIAPLTKRQTKLIIVVFIVTITTTITYFKYFGKNRQEIFGFYPETTIVGNYIKPRLAGYDFYLTNNYPRDALTFLTYTGGDPYKKNYTWLENKEDFLSVQKEKKRLQFVMFPTIENEKFIEKLRDKFPEGQVNYLYYVDDKINRKAALLYVWPSL